MLGLMIAGSKEFTDQVKNRLEYGSREGGSALSFTYTNDIDDADIVVAEEGAFYGENKSIVYIEVKKGEDGLFAEQTILKKKLAPMPVSDIGKVLQGMIVMVNHMTEEAKAMDSLLLFNKRLEDEAKNSMRELQEFHNVQQRVYEEAESLDGFSTKMLLFPFQKVSGDFLATGKVGDKSFVVIGDVTGHGYYAATYASIVTALVRSYFDTCPSYSADVLSLFFYLSKTAYCFHGESDESSGECVLCEIDHKTRTAKFCSFGGGMIPPIIVRKNGEVVVVFGEEDHERFVPRFGDHLVDDVVPFVKEIPYRDGDAILFYTDGLLEVFSNIGKDGALDRKHEYGVANMMKVLKSASSLHGNTPDALVKAVIQDVGSYGTKSALEEVTFEEKLNDDATIFCIRKKEKQSI